MYLIKKCTEVQDSIIFEAFKRGFADYPIKFNMSQDSFIKHFFGPEGNEKSLSFVALQKDEPIGIILGGIKSGENFKTLRCGAMAIVPKVRGTGLATELIQLHRKTAENNGCRQLFLEVIDNNERAIKFYKKHGYEKVYNLIYRLWKVDKTQLKESDKKVEIATYQDIVNLRNKDQSHIPWQSDIKYFENIPCNHYCIKENNKPVAGLTLTKAKIFYIWVAPEYRRQGYATALLNRAIEELQPSILRLNYANNSEMHTFANHLGMELEPISQYEMYLWLGK